MYKISNFFYHIEIFESKNIFPGFNPFTLENVYIVLELYSYTSKKKIFCKFLNQSKIRNLIHH